MNTYKARSLLIELTFYERDELFARSFANKTYDTETADLGRQVRFSHSLDPEAIITVLIVVSCSGHHACSCLFHCDCSERIYARQVERKNSLTEEDAAGAQRYFPPLRTCGVLCGYFDIDR
jgi:hypothetical protein